MINKKHQYKKVSLIIPCFNEGSAIPLFFARVLQLINPVANYSFEFICVDDGSQDDTLRKLSLLADARIKIVELSRNFGKEAALTAGIMYATGDAIIPIDADLQDPPELILPMLKKWEEGFEVVLAKRADRSCDSILKHMCAALFYKINNLLVAYKIPPNVGDFRLMDRVVIEALKKFPERQRFMKGLFAWLGFKTTIIEFKREQRIAGKTKWKKWYLWNFALEGIVNFSTLPLRIWSYLGITCAFIAICYASWIVVRVMLYGIDVPGYASLLVAVLFLGGIQLIGIGVIGEYLGRTYQETKQRPIYLVRKLHNFEQ